MRRWLISLMLATSALGSEVAISHRDVIPTDNQARRAALPNVAAGDGFLVAWNDQQSLLSYISTIQVRTYDADGTPRQAVPLALRGGTFAQTFWNGEEFVVLTGTAAGKLPIFTDAPVIFSTRVRPDGTLPPNAPTTVIVSKPGAVPLGVAFDGTRALAPAFHGGGYHLLLLDRTGHLLEDTPIAYEPAAVAVKPGGGFFVLRREVGDAIAAGDDRLAVLDHSETGVTALILDGEGAELERFALSSSAASSSSITWDGSAWIAAYPANGALCTARFTGADDVFVSCDVQQTDAVAIAAGSQRTFKAWTDNGWLYTDGGLASTRAETASQPHAVVDDEGLLVVWLESARIHLGGRFHDGTARPETIIETVSSPGAPRLARSGHETMLAWIENNHLFARLLGTTETKNLGDGFGPILSTAGDDDGFLIAWSGQRGVTTARFDRELNVLVKEELRSLRHQLNPLVARTANGFLVTWLETDGFGVHIIVEPLDAGGHRTSGPIELGVAQDITTVQGLGCGESTCLVTWYSNVDQLWGAVVRADGTPLSANRVSPATDVYASTFVEALPAGAFRVWHGNVYTPVAANGDPGEPQAWHAGEVAFGNLVNWRGHLTAVYTRQGQIFAYEFVPRSRAIRR